MHPYQMSSLWNNRTRLLNTGTACKREAVDFCIVNYRFSKIQKHRTGRLLNGNVKQ